MKRRDVESSEMGKQLRSRRARRHHLELVTPDEEWPDDLFPLLQMARDGMLEQESPAPTAEVLAFLEEPAHGKVDGEGLLLRPLEVEPIELAPLGPERHRTPRRALVTAAGAAAALALVMLGLRPTFTGPKTTITSARTTVPEVQAAPTTTMVAPTEPAATVSDATAEPVPVVPLPPEVTAAAPATPDTTVAPAATAPPTTAKAVPSTSKPKRTSGSTRTTATTVAPPPAPSASDIVLAYYTASNARGKCVAHQPSRATQDQLVAACGATPVPPANLLQYWAARDSWNACAEPFVQKGWSATRVASACGVQPQRGDYGVPPNPYSKSQNS